MCVARSFSGIAHHAHLGAAVYRASKYRRIRVVFLGARQGELETKHVRGVDPRVRHVVTIPDPGEALSGVAAEVLLYRKEVGQHLTWVHEIGETVDDRHIGVARELLDLRVRESPDHYSVDVARKDAGRICYRLAPSELDVARRQEQRVPAQLPRPDLKGDPRPCGRLHEDHPQ